METSHSLLDTLQVAPDREAWKRLVEVYSPMIQNWLKRYNVTASDSDDIVQEVLIVVVRRFPEFRREPRVGAFRSWLKTITVNCLRDHWRRRNKHTAAVGGTEFVAVINQLADPESRISKQWDEEHDAYVTRYLLEQIRPNFSDKTWTAFQRFALDGLSADQVAAELDMSPNAVFISKAPVLASLRQLGRGLVD